MLFMANPTISVQIPDSGFITSVSINGEEYTLDDPIEVRKGDTVIDLTGAYQKVRERIADKKDRDFIESP